MLYLGYSVGDVFALLDAARDIINSARSSKEINDSNDKILTKTQEMQLIAKKIELLAHRHLALMKDILWPGHVQQSPALTASPKRCAQLFSPGALRSELGYFSEKTCSIALASPMLESVPPTFCGCAVIVRSRD